MIRLEDLPPLTQRQERRALPLVKSAASVDSWDFATTVHSSRTLHLHHLSKQEESTMNGVFVMEEDMVPTFCEEPEFDLNPAPSPSTSDYSLRSFALDDAPSVPDTTPSSYTDTSETVSRTQSENSLTAEARSTGEQLASIAEHATQPSTEVSRTPPTSRKPTVSRKPSDSSSTSDSRRNIWQRLKSNVKRSSPSNLLDSQSLGSSPSKGRISGMLSASKGLLTGNSGPRV